jgi:hypothetical protein
MLRGPGMVSGRPLVASLPQTNTKGMGNDGGACRFVSRQLERHPNLGCFTEEAVNVVKQHGNPVRLGLCG